MTDDDNRSMNFTTSMRGDEDGGERVSTAGTIARSMGMSSVYGNNS